MEIPLLPEKAKKQILIWRILTIFFLIVIITLAILYGLGVGWKEEKKEEKEETPQEIPKESLLTLWKEGAESKKKINRIYENNNR